MFGQQILISKGYGRALQELSLAFSSHVGMYQRQYHGQMPVELDGDEDDDDDGDDATVCVCIRTYHGGTRPRREMATRIVVAVTR